MIGKESGIDWSAVLNDDDNAKHEYSLNFKQMTEEESRSWVQSYSSDLIYVYPTSISRHGKDLTARRNFCDSFINSYKVAVTAAQTNSKS
uniref:Uncharacterized protein n=1 Tax=Plectus sambesii TaxID=2011161 RepID=A0A914X503_9BILA